MDVYCVFDQHPCEIPTLRHICDELNLAREMAEKIAQGFEEFPVPKTDWHGGTVPTVANWRHDDGRYVFIRKCPVTSRKKKDRS